jgi:signal transduction histidine kinase
MSIFTKLLIIIIAAGAVINLLVGGFFRYQFIHSDKSRINRNMSYYVDLLVTEIGVPPDLKKAKEISRKTKFEIAISGPHLQWSSSAGPPSIRSFEQSTRIDNTHIYMRPKGLLLVKEQGGYRFMFSTIGGLPFKWPGEYLIFMILMLTAVLVGSYALIRYVLWPVKLLSTGVNEITGGNLDHDVPVRNRDELGELTGSFNGMKNRLKEMLRSREQLLLDVSHELRSPLTRIKVALEFIEDGSVRDTLDEDVREIEGMIAEILETERLKHLDGKLEIEKIDIAGLIAEVAGTLGISSAALNIERHSPAVAVMGDRKWIKMMMKNVLENAKKNSDEDKELIDVTLREGEGGTSVMITDHGAGIPEKDLPYVFEPFYRADSSRSRKTGGYGLGLALCKKIMEAHGGLITIQSSPGAGTSVWLKFRA